jgi:hypothetical protein
MIARVTPDPHGRTTYYSNRMTDDEMRERIFTRRTYKAKFVAEQQAKNQGLADRIKAAKGTFNSDSADAQSDANKGHREGTDKAPEGQQEGTGKGNGRAPIIETPSIETLSTETPLSRNTENRNPPKDLAPVGAGEVVFEEKKVLDSFFTEPIAAQWTAFLKAILSRSGRVGSARRAVVVRAAMKTNHLPVSALRAIACAHDYFFKRKGEEKRGDRREATSELVQEEEKVKNFAKSRLFLAEKDKFCREIALFKMLCIKDLRNMLKLCFKQCLRDA